ncbi:hypothetical protein, partial [Bacillus cereus group sp. MYBK74-1]|uniref:hypothetical protein n=1 Tax=Bacillus cereus group sp. MYBK74-1 TaxID=3450610 RepID=UPI003F7AC665
QENFIEFWHIKKALESRTLPSLIITLPLVTATLVLGLVEKNHAKQKHKISCPYGQLIYIITVIGSSILVNS